MSKVLVSMPKPMLESLDRLVGEGFYASRSEAIRDGLRLLFQSHGGDEMHGGDELIDFVEAIGEQQGFSYS